MKLSDLFSRCKVTQNGCRVWRLCINRKGYGRLRFNNKTWSAHRLSWYLTNGPIPNGKWVLHKCDNPACINPAHLYLGNHIDNMRDMKIRKRAARPIGSKNPKAKLSEGDVLLVIKRIAHGESFASIAEYFGVDPSRISRINAKLSWRHV